MFLQEKPKAPGGWQAPVVAEAWLRLLTKALGGQKAHNWAGLSPALLCTSDHPRAWPPFLSHMPGPGHPEVPPLPGWGSGGKKVAASICTGIRTVFSWAPPPDSLVSKAGSPGSYSLRPLFSTAQQGTVGATDQMCLGAVVSLRPEHCPRSQGHTDFLSPETPCQSGGEAGHWWTQERKPPCSAVSGLHCPPPLRKWKLQTAAVSGVSRHFESSLTVFSSILNILMIQRIATHSASSSYSRFRACSSPTFSVPLHLQVSLASSLQIWRTGRGVGL